MTKMTDDEALRKCADDPKFFAETFLWIVGKDRKKIPFVFNAPQNAYYASRTRSDLILKARKEGFSTLIEAMWIHACIFGENENCVTMAHTWDDTVIHLDRVKFFLETMSLSDVKVEVPLDKNNQRELYFPHSNSRLWIGTAGANAFGRGRDITRLHLSEAAFYPDASVVDGVMEACVPSATKIIETTANGTDTVFFPLWNKAKTGNSTWKNHFFAWHTDKSNTLQAPDNLQMDEDERKMAEAYNLSPSQVYWYRTKKNDMRDPALMAQEHPSDAEEAFISSGQCIFDPQGLKAQRMRIEEPEYVGVLRDTGYKPEFVIDPFGPLKIFRHPESGRRYRIGADAAKGGDNGDFSVANVIDEASRAVVAIWMGRIDPVDFGRALYGLGLYYNTAVLVVEGWPGPGIATVGKLAEMRYPNLWKAPNTKPDEFGWTTNERSKNDIIGTLQDAIKGNWTVLRAAENVNEFSNFVRSKHGAGWKIGARSGCHDDCVISLGIALHTSKMDRFDGNLGSDDRPMVSVSLLGGKNKIASHKGPAWRRLHVKTGG